MAVGDIWRCHVLMRGSSNKVCSVGSDWKITAEVTPNTPQNIADAFDFRVQGTFRLFLQNGAQTINTEAFKLHPPPAQSAVSAITPGTGLRVPAAASLNVNNVSALVTKLTAFAGVKFRGRMYLPCMADSDFTDLQVLTAPVLTALTTFCTDMLVNLIPGNTNNKLQTGTVMEPHLYHRATHTSDKITQFLPRSYPGSQRRRFNERW